MQPSSPLKEGYLETLAKKANHTDHFEMNGTEVLNGALSTPLIFHVESSMLSFPLLLWPNVSAVWKRTKGE